MSSRYSRKEIKVEAERLGFFACGIARAEPVDAETAAAVRGWISKGSQATMDYMANYTEKRLNPCLLVPGTKSIVSLAMNYAPAQTMPETEYQLAAYAYGQDYHDVMKAKLRQLAALIANKFEGENDSEVGENDGNSTAITTPKTNKTSEEPTGEIRVFVDTAPVLERYWAQRAGLGWIGKNHQLIIPRAGSMFFLGEIFLPYEFESYDSPMPSRCGNCRRCIEACPTCAITDEWGFDSEKCLSYQLIENRGELSEQAKQSMGTTIYGCDRCQTACPWNKFATPNTTPEFQPKSELLAMTKADWHNLTIDEYRALFKGSAVKRVKFDGLKRNISAKE
ncbi:epoxyqueuosine reductase [Prevotella intermedia ATCC 25611 = DSM 20706]|uniref:tRNA epoxyqueuosine(34) reductase QueG n=1 Tax=Prevotella intermedia TaxID=28131 RepID=UPI0003FF107F|nr:tRNA epoxyqueuosine(34) reductase QueG [Prevotella intermedia]APW32876.1 epoxyqueuosine reductase [Prevotella intermedia ATCC 25611 = DSM 20706]SUB97988.1 Epoxyqueuosine reductase [Prevotella intermedia]